MPPCDRCGSLENLPYQCAYCGGTFCGQHRLPENHDCPGLANWNDPKGIFGSTSGPNSSDTPSGAESLMARLPIDTGPGGPLSYFRGNMTYAVLAVMVLCYLLQYLVFPMLGFRAPGTNFPQDPGDPVWRAAFLLDSANPLYVWTWVTSIFAHGSITHLLVNGIVIFFFGQLVERHLGTRAFSALFIGAGVAAGLGQISLGFFTEGGSAVLGASGAALAILGVLTVLNPNLRVLLFFFIPMPLWLLTAGFTVISVGVMLGGGIGAGGIAHGAHLIGLGIGLVYGKHVKDQVRLPNQLQLGGGPGGPPGPRRPGGPGGRF